MLELGGNCVRDEMLELGGNCAGDKRTAITARHLTLAVSMFPLSLTFVMIMHCITVIFDIKHPAQAQVHKDEEIFELLKCCTLLRGGVFPNIRDTLFDPRQHSEQAFKLVPTQIKLLTRAGEDCKLEVRQTCESRTASVDIVVNRGDVLVVKTDDTAAETLFFDSNLKWQGAKRIKYFSKTGVVLQVHELSVLLQNGDGKRLWWPYGTLRMFQSNAKTFKDNADTVDIQFVTGVALETEVGEMEMEHLEKQLLWMREKKIEDEQNMTLLTLACVSSWSAKQLAEASIFKFRDLPQKAPSLPQDVVPLQSFMCPISMDLKSDPVSTVDGMTFERRHIEKWLKKVPLCVYVSSCACSRYSILILVG